MTALDDAIYHARRATKSPKWLIDRVRSDPDYDYTKSELYQALVALYAATHTKPAPAPAPAPTPAPTPASSPFNGIGVFTAWDPAAALQLGSHADWVAVQLDSEGGKSATSAQLRAAGYKRVFGWEARPSRSGYLTTTDGEFDGYIGQAESQAELDACLAIGVTASRPHALVGNPTAWTDAGHTAAKAQGWGLIIEWYWNVQPWMTAIDSRGYTVDNVLFGTYDASSENPQYGRRVPLHDYLVRGYRNWSVYLAETLTADDLVAFKAAR